MATDKPKGMTKAITTTANEGAGDRLKARLDEIQRSVDVLNQTVDRLDDLTADEVKKLDLPDKQARAHAISDAYLAIEDLENAKLMELNAAFESKRPSLQWATTKLSHDLAQLANTVEFIRAAASAIGIIADLVKVIPK